MYLAMIETTVDAARSNPAPSPAVAPLQDAASRTLRYHTTGVAEDHLVWCELDAEPDAAASGGARITILRQTQTVGRHGDLRTPWLYLVHTDIAAELLDEYNAWYGEEHLPRLVKVPGILRARRFTALVGAPRFLTAYDLEQRDAFESPEGLIARKTPWTERMRSQFANTRRIMCRLIEN